MAVVVMGREMLVTVLRSMIEGSGGDFSANKAGKWKMLFQCVAVVASLVALETSRRSMDGPLPPWLYWTLHISVWLAVLSTIYSGVIYIFAAARQMPK
jgi:CDP-diacylglycerol--glycerol-3-phosphate 3-phosphatidyltransferase